MLEFPAQSIDLDQRRSTRTELIGPDPSGSVAAEVGSSPRPARSHLGEPKAPLPAIEDRAPKQIAMALIFANATRRCGS